MADLLPIQIIRYDPVTRQIVKEKRNYEILFGNRDPVFYETGYFYHPYVPREPHAD